MSIDDWARIVWDYHHVGHALAKADCIIVLGSHDTRVVERGAEVFLGGWAPILLLSGHLGALTSAMWSRSEAEVFADVAVGRGVPRDRILIEARSTNTGENVDFSRQMLAEKGLHPRRAIAVQKPYMERRTLATFRKRWPELEVVVTSPQIDFDAYPTGNIRKDDVIHIMVGDLQRLIVYGRKGWSVPQDVPAEVMEAYEQLVAAGYTRRMLKEARLRGGSMAQTASTMMLPLGAKAPSFELKDPFGRAWSLAGFDGSPALLVAFICNHCPFVRHLRAGFASLAAEYRQRGVAVVAIASNDAKAYPEDGPDGMAEEAKMAGYTFPYLFDETQEVAKAYGAACTPDFFLFDRERRLFYRGQMDGSRPGNGVPVTGEDLRKALDAALEGRPAPEVQRPSLGCNIKWKPGNEPAYFPR